jgi:hypothetical protein
MDGGVISTPTDESMCGIGSLVQACGGPIAKGRSLQVLFDAKWLLRKRPALTPLT